MGLFTRQTSEIGRLHYLLRLAFDRVKRDTQHLFHWVEYFHKKHQQHDQRLERIEQHVQNFSTTNRNINQETYVELIKRIQEIKDRLDLLEEQREDRREPKIALKERLLRKITKNSKEYIKSVISSVIKKYGRISGPQLKEIIVEEQGICSKSSFYRLLAEIELESEIASFAAGKEKTYFIKNPVLR